MMSGLLKNELIKLYKQNSYRILTAIIIALIILTPIAQATTNALFSLDLYSAEDEKSTYLEYAEEYDEGSINWQYYIDSAEAVDLFIDENGETDWRYEVFYFDFSYLFMQKKVLEYIDTGKYTQEEIENSYYYGVVTFEGEFADDPIKILQDYDAMKKQIENDSFGDYLAAKKSVYQAQAAFLESSIASLEKKYADHEPDVESKYELDVMRVSLEATENITAAYDIISDKAESTDDWRYRTVELLVISETEKSAYMPMPIEVFEKSSKESNLWSSYDEYKATAEKEYAAAVEASELFLYSLENGIPIPTVQSTVKSDFRSGITGVAGLLVIVSVIVCGLIISNEFSSGTIRLLLIRPRTRSKILTSKILAVLIYISGLAVLALLILFIFGIVMGGGVGDIFVPDLYYIGGSVIAVPSVLVSALILLEGILPVLFFGALAMLLSVMTKKAALSIALPLVLNSIGATVQSVSLMISEIEGAELISLLPTTYVDLTIFNCTAADYYASIYGMNIMNILGGGAMYYSYASQMFPILGIIYYAAFIAGMLVLVYTLFKKKQIKD